jgi:hypothetical protein
LKPECGNQDSPVQYGARLAPTDQDQLIDDRP